ncbi:MAG: hypothetical protein IPM22_18475 [Betaproteobacteria bacterium]|nr:hypothetical protein [Betaproteobacteria bacterium]MCC7216617.1 hypothetical protein [Burkholderiales bacterium]
MAFSPRRLLPALALALAACAAPQPEVVRATGAPQYPPTQFVELLDRAPDRPYTELGTIDVPGEPGALRAQVLAQIRTHAQQLGADAVILTDQSRMAPASQRLNPTTGTYETIGGQVIPAFRGVAIRFR